MGQVETLHVGGSGFAVKVGQKSGAIDDGEYSFIACDPNPAVFGQAFYVVSDKSLACL